MKRPNLPANEVARLAALASYEILDTDAEASFDALAQLAADVLDTPIALVCLIDGERQWFKSRHGVDITETPRDISFCGHVVADGSPLVVRDARDDPRFTDNPMVTGAGVRFYAGMPLRTVDGFVLGTLCTLDREPKTPTPRQLRMLALLADQTVQLLEARRERRKLALQREAAVETARRLDVVFDAMSEGVVVYDAEGAVTAANAAAERILGLSADQIAGRVPADASYCAIDEGGARVASDTQPALVAMRTGRPTMNVVSGIRKPTGDVTWISTNALPVFDDKADKPSAVITTFHDVTTERLARAAEEHLSRQERLVTIGTLVAGVGHEINNPLAYVLANIKLALDELRAFSRHAPGDSLREVLVILQEAHQGGERIRAIVRSLRAFAREESAPTATDVAGAVDFAINMASHETRQRATVVARLGATPMVLTDESRLSQVLVSLVVNAAQAFPSADVDKNRITITSSLAPDGRVRIEVEDNGPGVPPELHRRIFDPFFSTKPPGSGTGLGLSVAQNLVNALGAELALVPSHAKP